MHERKLRKELEELKEYENIIKEEAQMLEEVVINADTKLTEFDYQRSIMYAITFLSAAFIFSFTLINIDIQFELSGLFSIILVSVSILLYVAAFCFLIKAKKITDEYEKYISKIISSRKEVLKTYKKHKDKFMKKYYKRKEEK